MTPEQESQHLKDAACSELCIYLAAKVRRARHQRGESQTVFAARAGVSLRTYKRFETHGSGQMDTLMKVLVALDRSQYLSLLFPFDAPPLSLQKRVEAIQRRQH